MLRSAAILMVCAGTWFPFVVYEVHSMSGRLKSPPDPSRKTLFLLLSRMTLISDIAISIYILCFLSVWWSVETVELNGLPVSYFDVPR